jgi:hypothetical protein
MTAANNGSMKLVGLLWLLMVRWSMTGVRLRDTNFHRCRQSGHSETCSPLRMSRNQNQPAGPRATL